MPAVLQLLARDWLGEQRLRGYASLVMRLVLGALLALVMIPAAAVLGRALAGVPSPGVRENVAMSIALTSTGTWLVAGCLFGARLSLDFDFRRLLVLPISFRRLFAVRVVAGLGGRWLLLFAPLLLAVAWAGSRGGFALVRSSIGIALWAIVLAQLVTAAIVRFRRIARSGRSALALFVVLVVASVAVFAVIKGGWPAVSRAIERFVPLAGRLPSSALLRWSPPGVLGHGLVHDMPLVDLVALAAYAGLAVWLSARMVRVSYFNPRGEPADQGTARRTARQSGWAARGAVTRALVVADLTTLSRIPNIRVLMLFGLAYCPVFTLAMAHGEGFTGPYLLALLVFPFMMTGTLKSNLFGLDARSNVPLLSMPLTGGDILRAKLLAINLLTGVLIASVALAVAIMRPPSLTFGDFLVAASVIATAFLVSDIVGSVGSLKWPKAISWGKAFPSANQAGSNALFLSLGVLFVLALVPRVVERRLHWPGLTISVDLLLLIAAAAAYVPFRRWQDTALVRHRDRLLTAARS